MRYSVNCSILFTDLPILQRPEAARKAGFDAVEFWWPFDNAVPSDAEVEAFIEALQEAGVQLTGLNFAAGDMPAGDRGLLSHPNRVTEFRDNILVVADIGRRTGCRAFNALYGNRLGAASEELQDATALANLALAAETVDGVVLVEPLSGSPAYPLKTAAEALAVVAQVPGLKLLADLYHLAVNGEDVDALLRGGLDRIGHVQIADAPGRGAPGTGDLPLAAWLTELDQAGYDGWIGLEYKANPGEDPFAWLTSDPKELP
ncbi:hydroxypyruvate isomerase family protein [Nonomuraea typhae]|uniref:hydroxypyruvate isomerase family protein n=1 Tax=Nonomuraea typhae TaxID=2603600 RepID=UPI0012F7AD33|nr:TIM barrel protein [Nonomuraea typhae]